MHFTPMRASVSTIGPPYGTEAPPPSSTPAEGLIHAFRQRFTASLLGPWINCPCPVRSGPPLLTERLLPSHLRLFTEPHLLSDPRWNLLEEQLIAWLGAYLRFSFSLVFQRLDNDRSKWRNICQIAPTGLAEVRVDFISWRHFERLILEAAYKRNLSCVAAL